MPTGYTAYIENGDITTGKDFLTLCCRAFGACIDMKDELLSKTLPEKFEPDSYYKERYDKAKLQLEGIKNLTKEEVIERINSERKDREESITSQIKKQEDTNAKYLKVRNEVKTWIPPTSEHVSLKKFALEQINMSIRNYSDYYNKELEKIHIEISPEDYISEHITMCEDDV